MLLSMKVSNLKGKKRFLEYFKSLKEEKVVCLTVATYLCGDLTKGRTVTFDVSAASQATEEKNYQVWKARKEIPCFPPHFASAPGV